MEIKVIRYVRTASGELVNVQDLNSEQRGRLATWLNLTVMNEAYRGEAEFRVKEGAAAC